MVRLNIKRGNLYFIAALIAVFIIGFVIAVEHPNPGHGFEDLDVPEFSPPFLDPGIVCTSTNSETTEFYEQCGCNIPPLDPSPPFYSPTGVLLAPGDANYIAKFNAAESGLTKSVIFEEPVSGNIGFGTNSPAGKIDIRGDEMRIWDGTTPPGIAAFEGDLFVGGNFEVDDEICLGNRCSQDWGDDIEIYQQNCDDFNKDDGLAEICVIGPADNFRFCALSSVNVDDGACLTGLWPCGDGGIDCGDGVEGPQWLVVAEAFQSGGNYAAQCTAYCIIDFP